MTRLPCPVCKRGIIHDDTPLAWCSRRFDKRKPCMVEVGQCSSPEEFERQAHESVRLYEKNKRAARKLFDSPRRLSELKKYVEDTTLSTIRLIAAIDAEMKRPSDNERGKRIARIANALDMANDALMHFGLGYSFAKIKKLKKPEGAGR